MTKREIIRNIKIAKKYLAEYHLLVPEKEIVLECLFLPPFRWNTYFIQVFMEHGGYCAHCAYTFYGDHMGNTSHSQPFTTVEIADKQPAFRGDVICKCMKIDSQIVEEIIRSVQEDAVLQAKESTVIDGISACVRWYDQGIMIRDCCLNDPEIAPALSEALVRVAETIATCSYLQ